MRIEVRLDQQVFRQLRELLVTTDINPPIGTVTKHVVMLTEVDERLSAHIVAREASDRALRGLTRTAREQALIVRFRYMRPLERLGKVLFPPGSAMRQKLAMPKAENYAGIVAGALGMAVHAAEHRQLFVDAGFAADFVEQLTQAAKDLKTTLDLRAAERGRRSAATAGMLVERGKGRDLVRLLDALILPQLQANPRSAALAEWRTLTRFTRVTPAERKEVPIPAPGTGVVTTPTTEEHAA